MANLDSLKAVYPETFFNIEHPTAPWISIQFRKAIGTTLNDKNSWDEITLNPSNLFDGVTIQDESGFQKVELRLSDINFHRLENVVTKSILLVRANNLIAQAEKVPVTDTGFFEFRIDNNSMINMRLRFGYTDSSTDYIDDTKFEGDYQDRVTFPEKTVIRSPWIYFQILDAKFTVTESGLSVILSCFSTTEAFLERAKLVKRFAILKGSATDVIDALKKMFEDMSKKNLTIEKIDTPEIGDTISINLGTAVNETSASLRTVRNVLDELCNAIPPKKFKVDNEPTEDEEEAVNSTKYSYTYSEKNNKGTITFYYPIPGEGQEKARTYIWKEHGQSIVNSFSVESRTDFAALNRQIFVRDVDGTVSIKVARPQKDGDENNLGRINDVSEALRNFDITFVSDSVSDSTVAQQLVRFLNEGVFDGTLELPGDPFYLFDNKLKPYQYMIKIIVLRPSYIDEDGEYVYGDKSYLSGNYVIKRIAHNITNAGFTTSLEVMRWPAGEA